MTKQDKPYLNVNPSLLSLSFYPVVAPFMYACIIISGQDAPVRSTTKDLISNHALFQVKMLRLGAQQDPSHLRMQCFISGQDAPLRAQPVTSHSYACIFFLTG